MATKIYIEGLSIVIDDGVNGGLYSHDEILATFDRTLGIFKFIISENRGFNIGYADIQNELGVQAGATFDLTKTYLSPIVNFTPSGAAGIDGTNGVGATFSAKVNEVAGVLKGQVAYISGATGGFAQVSLADNTNFSKSDVLAFATESKTDGQTIIMQQLGLIEGFDTSAFTEGDILYLGTSGI